MYDLIFRRVPAVLLLVVFGLIVLHAPLTVFLGTQFPEFDLLLKAWKELLIGGALLLVVYDLIRRGQVGLVKRDVLFWVAVAYVALHGVMAALQYGTLAMIYPQVIAQAMAGLAIDLRYVLFFLAVYLLIKLHPEFRRRFVTVGIIGAGIVVGFALLQQVLPPDILKYIGYSRDTIVPYLTVDQNPDYIRINSTLRGPNPLGAYAAIVLSGCIAYLLFVKRKLSPTWARWVIAGLSFGAIVALWTSYSRSAAIALGIAVVILAVIRFRRQLRWWHAAAVLAVLALAAGGLYVARDTAFVHNVILHDNPETGAVVTSNDAHAESLVDSTGRMLSQPFGGGIGSTGSASLYGPSPLIIENQYLFIAHESGWLGLVLFVAIFMMILRRLWVQRADWLAMTVLASGVGLGVICLIQPVWVDDTVSIIWWGLAGLVLAKGGDGERTADKKAKRTA